MSWYDDDDDDLRKRKRGSASYVGVSPFLGAVDHGYGPELSGRSPEQQQGERSSARPTRTGSASRPARRRNRPRP